MGIQKNKAAWADIRFESKTQSTRIYNEWATEVLSVQDTVDILTLASLRKAVEVSLDSFVMRSHVDIVFLVSWWSRKTYTFLTSWGEFKSTLEEVLVMFRLPALAYKGETGLVLLGGEKEKVRLQ